MSISVTPIQALKDNYIWAIQYKDNVIIVDPGEAAPVIHYLQQNQLSLTAIFITHHHWDHTNGIGDLLKAYNTPVYAPKNDKVPFTTVPLIDEDTITLAQFPTFRVLSVPGHTLGHVAYYTNGFVFTGDTLFGAGCGRLFEGTADQLLNSLCRLASLPPLTQIYCGHEYTLANLNFASLVEPDNPQLMARLKKVNSLSQLGLPSLPSSMADEAATNPFLRCHIPFVVQQVAYHTKKVLHTERDVLMALRRWKDLMV